MKRFFIVMLVTVLCLGVLGGGIWKLINSRSFQFFGGLVQDVETDEKVVALTFDDGPNEKTDEILKILKDNDVKATFYLIGEQMKKYSAETVKIVEAGHEIGNHSYTHQRMVLKSPAFVKEELDQTNKQIQAAGYQGPITFRPPYFKKLFILPYQLKQRQMKTILADVEPESYSNIARDSDKIIKYVISNTKPGSIILLHIWYDSRRESLESIEGIITGLREKGYQFKTVTELLQTETK
ncbi:polysaccharide deacetylase family protein [Pseudoneobacillus sp. C159]